MTNNSTRTRSARPVLRRLLAAGGSLVLTLATFAGLVVAGAVVTDRSLHQRVPRAALLAASTAYTEPEASGGNANALYRHPLVVAFVVGRAGTIASDLLAPYDIFASSPAFTTYVAAADAGPAPLEGAPAVMPTYTFASVDANPALRPDLIVVPGLTDPTGSTEASLRTWVARRHDAGARILGVCSGSLVLAATGMLDGLDATSHWSRIGALQHSRPAVHWVRAQRYVDDDSVTTTAAVTSGVPASLHLIAELAGPAEAQRVAGLHPELNWTPTATTDIPDDHFAVSDWRVGLNYVMPWLRPTVGVALRDGVGEMDATAAFEVYSQSFAARAVRIAAGDTVHTRHGLVLLTTDIGDAPALSWMVAPGAATPDAIDPRLRAWAASKGLTIEPLGRRLGRGFTAALQNLAVHTDAATTTATAKMIGYPSTRLDIDSRRPSVRPVLLAIAALALAILIGQAPVRLARRRRQPALPISSAPRRAGEDTQPLDPRFPMT